VFAHELDLVSHRMTLTNTSYLLYSPVDTKSPYTIRTE